MMITMMRTICFVRPSTRQHIDEVQYENDDKKCDQSTDEKRHEILAVNRAVTLCRCMIRLLACRTRRVMPWPLRCHGSWRLNRAGSSSAAASASTASVPAMI